jgi:hypothetical protein
MPSGGSYLVDQELADLVCQARELLLRQALQICGTADLFKHPVSVRIAVAFSRAATLPP